MNSLSLLNGLLFLTLFTNLIWAVCGAGGNDLVKSGKAITVLEAKKKNDKGVVLAWSIGILLHDDEKKGLNKDNVFILHQTKDFHLKQLVKDAASTKVTAQLLRPKTIDDGKYEAELIKLLGSKTIATATSTDLANSLHFVDNIITKLEPMGYISKDNAKKFKDYCNKNQAAVRDFKDPKKSGNTGGSAGSGAGSKRELSGETFVRELEVGKTSKKQRKLSLRPQRRKVPRSIYRRGSLRRRLIYPY